MAYENKPNTGVLFKNDYKERDTQPDLKGTFFDADGNEHWFSAWENTSRGGNHYINVMVGDIKDKQQGKRNDAITPPANADDDDIPF